MRVQEMKQNMETPSFKPHSQKNPLTIITSSHYCWEFENPSWNDPNNNWRPVLKEYLLSPLFLHNYTKKYVLLCTTQRQFLNLENTLWSRVIFFPILCILLMTKHSIAGHVSRLVVWFERPELFMDLMGICLWQLKAEPKADLSLTSIFPKEKIPSVFYFTIRGAAET